MTKIRHIVDIVVLGVPNVYTPIELDGIYIVNPQLDLILYNMLSSTANDVVQSQIPPPGAKLSKVYASEWLISRDPIALGNYTPVHDCKECWDGVAKAVDVVTKDPKQVVAIGTLYYDQVWS